MNSLATTRLNEFLHMKKGDGEFSYSQHTIIQIAATSRSKLIIEKGVDSLLSDEIIRPGDPLLRVADLGSGVGPIPLGFVSTMIEIVQKKCKELKWDDEQLPELQLYLNDLPSNDFNLLFKDLGESRLKEQKCGKTTSWCFAMGVPGSFHGRLFPRNSLHFVHSNYALHWLSQTPLGLKDEEGFPINRSNINVSETSPPAAIKAYIAQFEKDWTSFLRYRSEEMVVGGRVVLVIRGRSSVRLQPILELHLLGQAIASLVSQGLINEEKQDAFNFPTYCPSREEIGEVVQKEGSFIIEHIETIVHEIVQEFEDNYEKAETITKCIRGFSESVVSHHFGKEVLGKLYNELTQVTFKYVANKEPTEISSIIVLLKKRVVNCPTSLG